MDNAKGQEALERLRKELEEVPESEWIAMLDALNIFAAGAKMAWRIAEQKAG